MIGWSYEDGAACNGGHVLCRVAGKAHVLDKPVGRIAILIGPRTASAGEAVAIAFKGRRSVKLFGQPTAGQSTGNEAITLEDGAVLAIAAAVMVDRDGNHYGGQVLPDVTVPTPATLQDRDMTLVSAIDWIKQARAESLSQ